MSPIPSSDLPGHSRVHDRVIGALDRCQEDLDIEFKESAPWENLKYKIAHAVLGLGNLRDGGIIIIGVAERGQAWDLTGVTDEDVATYEPDKITSFVDSFASPSARLNIVTVDHVDVHFLAIEVAEFRDAPLVCKKSGPDSTPLRSGAFYVRQTGPPRTTRVTRAEQMQDLLELAAVKVAQRWVENQRRIQEGGAESSSSLFDRELGGL